MSNGGEKTRERTMPLGAKLLLVLCVAYTALLLFWPPLRPTAAWGRFGALLLCWGVPALVIARRWFLGARSEDRYRVRAPVWFRLRGWKWESNDDALPPDLEARTGWGTRLVLTALCMVLATWVSASMPDPYLLAVFGVLMPAVILSGIPAFRRGRV
ncbi:MAG: hypothetical protein ACYTGZ_12610 [Planctomycetota bacterium]